MDKPNLDTVPQFLRIEVLHVDEDIIVLNKPPNLRSVPGNADKTDDHIRKRARTDEHTTIKPNNKQDRKTVQDGWVVAIETCGKECDDMEISQIEKEILKKLACLKNRRSIPRKYAAFVRFCTKNQRNLFTTTISNEEYNKIISECFKMLKMKYEKMSVRREPTPDKDSAMGQLRILGYEPDPYINPIRIVHRLDCETSGLMVFARNEYSASLLCSYWREKSNSALLYDSKVQKFYLAQVYSWPPYQTHKIQSGKIDFPLAPSRTEKVKWEVRSLEDGGKPSLTQWQIYEKEDNIEKESSASELKDKFITLLLQPITGR